MRRSTATALTCRRWRRSCVCATHASVVERKYGKARRIWVFDRGIVSEANLAAIRKREGQYLVGTPRTQMKQFEAELLKEDWTEVRPEVEVKKVSIPEGEETYILCRTSGRKEKEKAIRNRFSCSMRNARKRGKGPEGTSEKHRHGTAERPQQNGAEPGKDTGPAPAGERSLSSRTARYRRGYPFVLGDEKR